MEYWGRLLSRLCVAVVVGLFYPIYSLVLSPLTLYGSAYFLKFIGYSVTVDLASLGFMIEDGMISIIPACVAISAYFLLFLLVIFTKDLGLKKSLKIFFLGALIIFIANVFRIGFLTSVLIEFGKAWFDMLHLWGWYFVSGLFVALTWIFLVYLFKIKTVPVYSDLKYLYSLAKNGK